MCHENCTNENVPFYRFTYGGGSLSDVLLLLIHYHNLISHMHNYYNFMDKNQLDFD